jgi:hypothetical protein
MMKSKIIIAILAIGFLFSNCKKDEVSQKANSADKKEITSNHQLKTQDPLDKYQKEVDKALKDLRKTLLNKAKQKKADELGISVMALPVDSIPEEELLPELTEVEITEMMEDLEAPSKSYLSSFNGLDYSQNTDEQVVLVAILGAEFDEGLGEGLSYDLIGNTITVYAPANGPTEIFNKLANCCDQTIQKIGYSFVTTTCMAVGGQIAGREGIKAMLTTLLGTSAVATLGGIAIGWMIADVLWCMSTQATTTT